MACKLPLRVERPLEHQSICGSFMLQTVGRLAGVPCLHKTLYRCHWVPAASMSTQASGMSKQLEKTDFGPDGFKWLTLKRIVYQDPSGRKRLWESAERTTRAASGCDAVAIIAKVRSKSEPLKIILEAQYRPSQDAMVVEVYCIKRTGAVWHFQLSVKVSWHRAEASKAVPSS
ncbi:TPA: hypothetical protein ACH3X2_007840 [Trebouxia sp. C0005]